MSAPLNDRQNRSDSESVEILIQRWKLNESTAKLQSTARKVLGLLTPLAQRRLTRALRLQVVAMPSADRAVWAYFPVYLTRRIAHRVRHILKPTTRVLLVISEKHFEEPWREESESRLMHHLGHVLLYLRSPRARNECVDATCEWMKNRRAEEHI